MSIYKTSVVTANSFNECCPNFVKYGTPNISNSGVVSDFSATNYLQLSVPFNPDSNTWIVLIKVKTGAVDTNNYVYGNYGNTYQNAPQIGISSAKWKMYIPLTNTTVNATGTYTVLADTDYWLKQYFDGENYCVDYSLNGVDYIRDITLVNSNLIKTATEGFCIGYNKYSSSSTEYWRGSIDLKYFVIKVGDKVFNPIDKGTISKYQITANSFYEI